MMETEGQCVLGKKIITDQQIALTIALTDPSRREIIDFLNKNPRGVTTTELAKELDLKIPTVMSHLRMLREVNAIRAERRGGKSVRRPLNYYYSLINMRTAKEINDVVEEATDVFSDYLIEATIDFLLKEVRLVPYTEDPYALADWLNALYSSVYEDIPAYTVFSNAEYLTKAPIYEKLAETTAKCVIFYDFMFLLHSYIGDLYAESPDTVRQIARRFGQSKIKSEEDITFVSDAIVTILSGPEASATRAIHNIREAINLLPVQKREKLLKLLPFMVRIREIPESIKSKIFTFFFFGDEKEIFERFKTYSEILRKR
jgi:DNA-binding transcriptional ArsR family regulator